jgi:hypothetical protein
MATGDEYQEAVTAYTAQLRGLFAASPTEGPSTEGITRGAAAVAPEALAERAEALEAMSGRLGELTAGFLEADGLEIREAAEMKMLAQATAEVDVARTLLEAAQEPEEGRGGAVTRGLGAPGLQLSLDELAGVLEAPLEMRALVKRGARRGVRAPADLQTAKTQLLEEARSTLRYISKQASKVGGRAAGDLMLLDLAIVREGASLLGKKVDELVDRLIGQVKGLLVRLAKAAVRLLFRAYQWVMALLGKEVGDETRQRIEQWVDEIGKAKQQGEAGDTVLGRLVTRLYGSDGIVAELETRLEATAADTAVITAATETVADLAERFRAKTEKVETMLKAIALVKRIPFLMAPPAQILVAGVTIGLLGYTVYTGYDHVDSGRLPFVPDRVEGVRETVQTALAVT